MPVMPDFHRVLFRKALVALAGILLLLILCGAVPEERLLWLMLLIVGARSLYLTAELDARSPTAAEWEAFRRRLVVRYGEMDNSARANEARRLGLPADAPSQELAAASLALFRQSLRGLDEQWAAYRGAGRAGFNC